MLALVRCAACGGEVASTAHACPVCGAMLVQCELRLFPLLLTAGCWGLGGLVLAGARGAVHEILAAICFLAGVVAISAWPRRLVPDPEATMGPAQPSAQSQSNPIVSSAAALLLAVVMTGCGGEGGGERDGMAKQPTPYILDVCPDNTAIAGYCGSVASYDSNGRLCSLSCHGAPEGEPFGSVVCPSTWTRNHLNYEVEVTCVADCQSCKPGPNCSERPRCSDLQFVNGTARIYEMCPERAACGNRLCGLCVKKSDLGGEFGILGCTAPGSKVGSAEDVECVSDCSECS